MPFKLIIAGSRSITDYATLRKAIIMSGLWDVHKTAIEVVSGKAKGVDTLGEEGSRQACRLGQHQSSGGRGQDSLRW